MTPELSEETVEAMARLDLLAAAATTDHFAELPVVARANAGPFAADVQIVLAALRSLSARNRAMREGLERQEVFIRTFMAAIDTFAPDTPDGHKLRIITTLGDLRALQRDRARTALSEQTK